MKSKTLCSLLLTSCCVVVASASLPTVNAGGQGKHDQEKSSTKEVYTGTAVAIGGQFGSNSRTFTLEITGHTPDPQAQQDLQILQSGGQDALMKAIGKDKLGFLSFEGQIGRDLNFVQ